MISCLLCLSRDRAVVRSLLFGVLLLADVDSNVSICDNWFGAHPNVANLEREYLDLLKQCSLSVVCAVLINRGLFLLVYGCYQNENIV